MKTEGKGAAPVGIWEEAMGELTKQNSWTRIPVSKSVCPQMSGSTSAWPHSAHTAEERANASSGEQLAGPDVPEGCPQGPALCLPCWLEAVEGKGPRQAPGSHSPSWAPLPRSRGAQPHACLGAPVCPFLPAHLSAAGRGPAPLAQHRELCTGMLCSHLAPPSWRPSASYRTSCALTASTARVPALSAPRQAALTLGLSPAAFALLQASRVTMGAL